jgi:hypothetical protein
MTTWLKEEHSINEYSFDTKEEALYLIKLLERQGWVNTQINWRLKTFIVELDKTYKKSLNLTKYQDEAKR